MENGSEKPDTFVDLKWTLLEKHDMNGKPYMYVFTHPVAPFRLLIIDMEASDNKSKAIRIVIETGIKTIDLDPKVKLSLYRIMLELAKIVFIKTYLFGDEDEIGIAADLDKKLLTKEEFEHHLASVLLTMAYLTSEEALKPLVAEKSLDTLLELVQTWFKRGIKREDALNNLVKYGLDKEIAEKIVDMVYKEENEEGEKKAGEDIMII